MKNSPYNEMSEKQLNQSLNDNEDALQNLKFQQSLQQLEDTSQILKTKKNIAQIKTFLNQINNRVNKNQDII